MHFPVPKWTFFRVSAQRESSASAWLENVSKIGSEYFWGDGTSRGGFFPEKKKKIGKFRNDKNTKLFHMKNDNTRISELHRTVPFLVNI